MSLDPTIIKEQLLSTNDIQIYIPAIQKQIQVKEYESAIISAANILLSNGQSKTKGLELIKSIVFLCSDSTLGENALKWSIHCTIHHNNDNIKKIKLTTLAAILKSTISIDVFNKRFVTDHLSNTLKTCLSVHTNEEKLAALQCLLECFKRYSSWFGNHKAKVETFLLNFLESTKKCEVTKAALAFHYFQQTGGAGVDGINYVNNFSFQFKKLCSTVHSLFNELFENLNEINNSEVINIAPICFTPHPPHFKSTERIKTTTTRLLNVLTFIKTMLIKQFPAVKQIVIKQVIELINRGMSVHACLFEKEISLETDVLAESVNKVQINLIHLFRILTRGHLISILPFSTIINKMLFNSIKRIQSCQCYYSDKIYRISIYKTLEEWTMLSKSSYNQESLIPLLLKDIVLQKQEVLLNLNMKDEHKRKQKNLASVDYNENLHEKKRNPIQEVNCIHALAVLKSFLIVPIFIKHTVWQELVRYLLNTIFEIQTGEAVFPYENITCQFHLYDLLLTIYQQEVNILPAIHFSCVVFRKGANSSYPLIAKICNRGIKLLEKISQPVCPSLNIYVDKPHKDNQPPIKSIDINEIEKIQNNANYEPNNIYINGSADNAKKIKILNEIVIKSDDQIQQAQIETMRLKKYHDEVKEDQSEVVIKESSSLHFENKKGIQMMEETSIILDEPPLKKFKDSDDDLEIEEMLLAFNEEWKDE